MSLPHAKIKVEIVRPIGCAWGRRRGHLVAGRCLLARQCRDKIWFPGSAAVVGKRLFNVVGIWSNVRPDKSNKDSPSVERLLVEEFATAVLELADLRLIHYTNCAVDKVLTPLMRLRPVKKQRAPLEMSGRSTALAPL